MYGKTQKLHNSQSLAPAEVLLVSFFPTFDGLHDDINLLFYWKLLAERELTIIGPFPSSQCIVNSYNS